MSEQHTDPDPEYAYEIKAITALDALSQFMAIYRRLNPGINTCSLDFEDGSRMTIKIPKGR